MSRGLRLGLAGLAASTVLFAVFIASGAAVMCLFAIAGILAGARLGISERRLTWIAFALLVVLWPLWLGAVPGGRLSSTLAHLAGGGILAFALGGPIRRSIAEPRGWPPVGTVVLVVFILGGVWELAEWATDALIGTSLSPSLGDSALDLVSDVVGALGGTWLAEAARPSVRT